MSPWISPEDVERLIDWTTSLRANMPSMPWAEPPEQPTGFDYRDQAEAEEFAILFPQDRPQAVDR